MNRIRTAIAAALLALTSATVHAQTPGKPVRLIVPYPAAGAVDIVSRLLADKLGASLGTSVIVENKAGAAGMIGADQMAKSAPDGNTLAMITVSSHAIAPSVYKTMPYDPVADFALVSLTANTPYIITVTPSVPARSLKELMALAKAKPGALNFGSSGTGTTPHLAGELFNTLAGVKINHIPYKGSAPMVNDLLGGQVQVAFDNTVIPHIKAGKLIGLAVTSSTRLAAVPDIPTAIEAGLPGYEAVGWMGLAAPRGTPADTVARLSRETARAMAQPDVVEKLTALGFQSAANTPEQFTAYVKNEITKWARVVKDAGITPE
jgi:tripartite-type tricarboxylate transporter receptor subunit TctC